MSGENSIGLRFGMKHIMLMIATVAVILLPIVYFREQGVVISI